MELLRELIRARALETFLARRALADGEELVVRPVSPAVPAARSLHARTDGTGDLFSMRAGAPSASLCMGLEPVELVRQRLGRATSPAQGRDPGEFGTDLQRGLISPFPLPGTLVEVMAGAAMAFRLRGESRVALLVDDLEGTASGDWHEGLNLAAVQGVPMVLVLQGEPGTPSARGLVTLTERAEAYGFTCHPVSGQDPREVEKVIWGAVEAARTGGGLQVVDVSTPGREPVDWLVDHAVDAGTVTRDDADAMIREADAEMEGAWAAVESEDLPSAAAVEDPAASEMPRDWSRWASTV